MVRTLAEPNLTALSDKRPSSLQAANTRSRCPTATASPSNTNPYGVELNFTPVVVDGDIINLTINAAVSSIDSTISLEANGFNINAFKRRETSTTVEMRDGESFASQASCRTTSVI